MGSAREIIEQIRTSLEGVAEKIRAHPYLEALAARKIPREKLALFAGQQYHIISSDLQSLAQVVGRVPSPATRDFFLKGLDGERVALRALVTFGRALGLTEADLVRIEPLPGAFAYSACVCWLAMATTAAEFAGAFVVNLAAWGGNCDTMSRALREQYRFATSDVAFFDLFALPPRGFEEEALAVVTEGLARGVTSEGLARAATLLQGYELLYWDTMHQHSIR